MKRTIDMQSVKILIAAAMVMLASNVLAGCTLQGPSDAAMERIEAAQAFKKTLELKLEEVEGAENVTLKVLLENPEEKEITSAQTWLSYNPEVLKGLNINTENTDFELTAPYDNNFDDAAGLVMIGRSNQAPVTEKMITVAEVTFQKVAEGAAMIEAYDYQSDLEGHTSANMVVDEVPYNLLLKPDTPLISIN